VTNIINQFQFSKRIRSAWGFRKWFRFELCKVSSKSMYVFLTIF